MVAGPFCGRLLADFGAEVLKVEPVEGDPVRSMGKQFEGKSLYAASIFRNKQLLAIDLRQPEGRELTRKIATQSDIVVENFRPGGLEKWGLGYEELARIHPGIIMIRISGYGQTGPYSERPGFGATTEAFSGLRHLTGDPDRPPARVAVSLTDCLSGLYGAFGAMLALLHRNRTGQGQCVDTALYECAFSFMEPHVPAFDKLGLVANRAGSRLPDTTPNNLYPTGDDRYVHITAPNDGLFRRLVGIMGQPQLASDPRFATARARAVHADEIDEMIAQWTSARDTAQLEACLNEAEVPHSRITTMADIFSDPHFQSRQMLARASSDDLGTVTLAGIVPKLSHTPGLIRHAGRCIGQDTRQVLRELVALSAADIQRLEAQKVIYCGDNSE